ncbi:MAG: hypothetical protein EHM55_06095 [Acidobacteria bacterium]|nr:MAG: hypothetical protein EHM55_06095 [Acidobacteriota bacterium]
MNNQAFFQQTITQEFDRFHNVLSALPPGKLAFRHEPKSRSAEELVGHLIGHIQDMTELIDAGVIHHRLQVPFDGLDDAVAKFDTSFRALESKLQKVSDEAWATPAEFLVGDRSIMRAPTQALMWMLFLDSVHHRGQLSTCIRPMGGKVPAIYGPSADTMMV